MKTESIYSLLAGGLLLGMSAHSMSALAASTEIESAAVDAYVYGYPLVTMELTRRSFTNVTNTNRPNG